MHPGPVAWFGRGAMARGAVCFAALMLPLFALAAAQALLVDAEQVSHGQAQPVTLPIRIVLDPGQPGPASVTLRWQADFSEVPQGLALYFPVLAAHMRLTVNGQTVANTLSEAGAELPRSVDRIVLLPVADALWQRGVNTIELVASGPRWLKVSAPWLGPMRELAQRQRGRVLAVVIGPLIAAAVVGTLGFGMLVLWSRTREPIYGYFGVGTFGWALHSGWSVLPWAVLPPDHYAIWWTAAYVAFVSMLVIFCLRLAEWRLPRLERAMVIGALVTPALLYAAFGLGWFDPVDEIVRVVLIGFVAFGVVAVGRAAMRMRTGESWLVAAAGAVSLAFAIHDWLLARDGDVNNPTYLVPYASLVFVLVVVRMLVDRFVQASREAQALNVELERRVESRSAELRHALEQMRLARNVAESADRAKTTFLAAASHDLRQPAHALGLYMEALRAEPLDADQTDLVQRMSGSLAALETMFNALLDVSRIDAGAVATNPRSFALQPMLRRLAEEFAPQAEAKGLRLALRLPATVALAASDEFLVERVLRNLLANALKYTAHGGILLACRQRGAGADAVWRVEVWDTGIGIAESDHERVFDEFFQVGNSARERGMGLGLGLAIVRRLVQLLGLTLELRSRLGRGSCFALRLPAQGPADLQVSPPVDVLADAGPTTVLAGITVAVIEDDADVRAAMRELLGRWGCHVVDGADAHEVARALRDGRPPQAIVADYRLADGRTGPGEARALQAAWQHAVPVLVVTGDAAPPLRHELEAAGCTCLAKPVLPGQLRAWLEQAAYRHLQSATGVAP